MRAALKALSYPDIDIRKTYPIERALRTAAGRPVLFYKPWDHVVHYGDHDIPVRIFSPETEGEPRHPAFFPRGRLGDGQHRQLRQGLPQYGEA